MAVERVAAAVNGEGVAMLGSVIATAAAGARTPEPAERREGRLCNWRSGPVLFEGPVDTCTDITEVAAGGEPAKDGAGAGAGAGEGVGTGTASGPAFFHTDRLMLRLSCE